MNNPIRSGALLAAAVAAVLCVGCASASAAGIDLTMPDVVRAAGDLLMIAIPAVAPAVDLTSVQTLREQRATLHAELTAILNSAEGETRDLTAEEQTAYDEKKAAMAVLD